MPITLGHTTIKRAISDHPRLSQRVPIPKATEPQTRFSPDNIRHGSQGRTNTVLSKKPHTNPPSMVATIMQRRGWHSSKEICNPNGSRNAKSVENSPRSSKFRNCTLENKGYKYMKSRCGHITCYKPKKGGSQQRQQIATKGGARYCISIL